jgi:hypothetical protein
MMYKKLIYILLLLAMCFPVAMAVTYEYTGDIKADLGSAQITSSGASGTAVSNGFNASYDWISMWINYDTVGVPDFVLMYSDNDALATGTGGFNLYDTNSHIIGSGTIQAQNGTGMYGGTGKQYYLFTFTSWTGYTNTGQSTAIMYVPKTGITRVAGQSIFYSIPKGWSATAVFGVDGGGAMASTAPGMIYQQKSQLIDVSYQVDKIGGSGLSTISNVNVIRNPSNNVATKVYAIRTKNATSVRYYSPYTTSTNPDYFVVDQDNYVISLYSPATPSVRYNSTVIFPSGYGPPVTPTPAATTTSAPSGYTRTTVFATDGSTGGKIVGATLAIRDVENSSWFNSTSSMSGSIVDVLAGHTLDIYGYYTGVYTPSYELRAVPGGNYYLPLMPPSPAPPGGYAGGYANLFVNVFDASTNNAVQHASVSAKLPTGATTGENTGTSGTVLFLVPNNTVVILSASASGYQSMSQSFNSGTGADKIVNIKLTRQTATSTVTPVVTDPGTGAVITAVPTIDARTSNQKDLDMMNLLRDNGGTIISIAILAIIFGLLKMIMKF